jgi:Ni/Co efflux regulator RcnB
MRTAWADPPEGHDRGHDRDEGRHDDGRREEARHDDRRFEEHRFADHDRDRVREYFVAREHEGRCPRGLEQHEHGCLPPGYARRWVVGSPLPPDVVYYPLPPQLVVQLTPPPVGYQYVRVASDILMIAAGTGMVAGAIQDLGR